MLDILAFAFLHRELDWHVARMLRVMIPRYLLDRDVGVRLCAMFAPWMALSGCSASDSGNDRSTNQCEVAAQPTLTVELEGGASDGMCSERLAVRAEEKLIEFECTASSGDCICNFYGSRTFLEEGGQVVLLSSNGTVKAALDVEIEATTTTSADGCRSWESYDDVVIPLEAYASLVSNGRGGMGGSL